MPLTHRREQCPATVVPIADAVLPPVPRYRPPRTSSDLARCQPSASAASNTTSNLSLRARHVVLRVVDDLVGAELAHELDIRRAAGRDDVRAEVLRHLHGEMSDAARRADDEHALAGNELRIVDQRLHGRAARHRRRGGMLVRDGVGNRHDAVRADDRVFRAASVASERRQRAEHALADVSRPRPAADADDVAGELDADGARRRANSGMKRRWPARIFQSSGSRLAAKIFTLTSPASGTRLGDLGDSRTSGGP